LVSCSRLLFFCRYAITAYFVDALARTGWSLSLDYADDSMMINPLLQRGWTASAKLLNGGPIFNPPPPNISYTILTETCYSYGTAWKLHGSAQYISVVILVAHLIIASVHTGIIMINGKTMEAWDSISELVVLAWNSAPTRRDEELRNCASGISRTSTLQNMVKVVAVEEEKGEKKVELVVVDEKGENKDGRVVENVELRERYG
jgi:hypothetical protein